MKEAVGSGRLKLKKTWFSEVSDNICFFLFEIKGPNSSASGPDGDESLAEWAAHDSDDVANDSHWVTKGDGFQR